MAIFNEKIYRKTDVQLKEYLNSYLKSNGYGKGTRKIEKEYLFARGTHPVLLVAHLDTVHKELPKVICYSNDGDYVMSPQGIGGDDRNGVCLILEILKTYHCSVLFTMGEECGGIGAEAFANSSIPETLDVQYIVEFDRRGTEDCVFYDLDNPEFEKFVESYGFATNYGSYSDICEVAPAVGVAAVNLSSGYFNEHNKHESVSINAMQSIYDRAVKMIADVSQKFAWKEQVRTYSKSSWLKYYPNYRKYGEHDYYSEKITSTEPDIYDDYSYYYGNTIEEVLATPLLDYYIYNPSGYPVGEFPDLYISQFGIIYFIDNYGLAVKLPKDYRVVNVDDVYLAPQFDEELCEVIYVAK